MRTLDGKRYISTVPVKLIGVENALPKDHDDAEFETATINKLKELPSLP